MNSDLKNRLHREFVENCRKSMKEAFHLANVHIKKLLIITNNIMIVKRGGDNAR